MSTAVLVTKLYIPPPRPKVVPRPRLIERLNEGLPRKLTLVCAPAGFGKTTVISEWAHLCDRPVAWLSLEEADSDPGRFLAYLVAALQTIVPNLGQSVLGALQTPQPPPTDVLLTALLNEITTIPDEVVLVLDDYHAIDDKPIDDALTFLLDHLPTGMHLVIATREDPHLPLARLRSRGQLIELRAADLRFTPSEAAEFLNPVMGLDLSAADIAALEDRTEGWIAGLQLAAISMRGHDDATNFIASFTGSHRFVLDYLVEEVLHQQPERVQAFLLGTSILDRLCGPLCDAVLLDSSSDGQQTLGDLERANLFIIPPDNDRRWYRYHHLFAELLRQRLHQRSASSTGGGAKEVSGLHIRASIWFEDNGLETEAFQHAAAANDIDRAERLINRKGMPLYVRGNAAAVLTWLESLPAPVLDARPSLRVMFATVLSIAGHVSRVEPHLTAAETALDVMAPSDETRDLVGRIASTRALLALLAADPRQLETIIVQSRRALEYLHPDNLPVRTAALWKLGLAQQYQGDRVAARHAYTEAIATSEASGNNHVRILATTGLGNIQETDNQLHAAAQMYRRVLELVGQPPGPVACEAHVGLARAYYEWNDLTAARRHGEQSVYLARQIEIATVVSSELFLARLQLAEGDVTGAIASLVRTERLVHERNFWFRMPAVAAVRVSALLRQGNLVEAAELAQSHDLSISQARVYLAQGNPSLALAVLEPWRRQVEAKGWADERLRVMVLQAVALQAHREQVAAVNLLVDALKLVEPGGLIRLFLDEGPPMARLLSGAAELRLTPHYASRVSAAFDAEVPTGVPEPSHTTGRPVQSLVDPLSQRELEVLQFIALGLSNNEISERLFLALSTIKGHNRMIFEKLQVQRRTEAVARARELGLL